MPKDNRCPFCGCVDWEGIRIIYDNSVMCKWCKRRVYEPYVSEQEEKEKHIIQSKKYLASLMDGDKLVDVTFLDYASTTDAWSIFYEHSIEQGYIINSNMYIKIILTKTKGTKQKEEKSLVKVVGSPYEPYTTPYKSYKPYRYPPSIQLTELACKKLYCYVDSTRREISGLGTVERRKKGLDEEYIVTDIFLFDQRSNGGYTILNKQAMAKFLYEKFQKIGKDTSNLRCWWHSHGDGGVGWSGTDDRTSTRNVKTIDDWMLALLLNRSHHIAGRVDYPDEPTHYIDHVDIEMSIDDKFRREHTAEATGKNKVKRYAPIKYEGGKKNGYGWSNRRKKNGRNKQASKTTGFY